MDRGCFSAAQRRATSEANWGAKEEAASKKKGEVLLRRGGLTYLYTPAPAAWDHTASLECGLFRDLFPGHIVHGHSIPMAVAVVNIVLYPKGYKNAKERPTHLAGHGPKMFMRRLSTVPYVRPVLTPTHPWPRG